MIGANLARWEYRHNAAGQLERVPVPFDCLCGEPASYGSDRWYCTRCWIGIGWPKQNAKAS